MVEFVIVGTKSNRNQNTIEKSVVDDGKAAYCQSPLMS